MSLRLVYVPTFQSSNLYFYCKFSAIKRSRCSVLCRLITAMESKVIIDIPYKSHLTQGALRTAQYWYVIRFSQKNKNSPRATTESVKFSLKLSLKFSKIFHSDFINFIVFCKPLLIWFESEIWSIIYLILVSNVSNLHAHWTLHGTLKSVRVPDFFSFTLLNELYRPAKITLIPKSKRNIEILYGVDID